LNSKSSPCDRKSQPCALDAQFSAASRRDRHCATTRSSTETIRARFGEIKYAPMKKRSLVLKTLLIFVAAAFLSGLHEAAAQGTAFTYHGQLNDNGSPVNGTYDLQFAIYDASSGPNLVTGPAPAH
jgi:hypothetical protein